MSARMNGVRCLAKKKGDGVVSLYGFNFGSADANPSVRLGDTTCQVHSYGLHSYDLHGYGLYSYGLHGYGLYSHGLADANPSVRLGDTTCRAQHLATYAWGMYADMRIEIYY